MEQLFRGHGRIAHAEVNVCRVSIVIDAYTTNVYARKVASHRDTRPVSDDTDKPDRNIDRGEEGEGEGGAKVTECNYADYSFHGFRYQRVSPCNHSTQR